MLVTSRQQGTAQTCSSSTFLQPWVRWNRAADKETYRGAGGRDASLSVPDLWAKAALEKDVDLYRCQHPRFSGIMIAPIHGPLWVLMKADYRRNRAVPRYTFQS